MGVLLVVGGRLGDRYGKRRLFLTGITGFTAASAVCGLAVDPIMLIAGRLVQGGFGALLIPQGIGILIATFSRQQIPRAVSAFGPVMGGSAVLGPLVAGFIIDADVAGLSWRPVFLINIVLGAVGLVAAVKLLPVDEPVSDVPIDGLGAGLLGASMFGLMYGLIEGSTAGWTAMPILSLVAGAVLLAGFGVRQRGATEPLILPSLLTNRGFTSGLLLGLAFFAAVNGLAYVVSLFFQTALGLTPSSAALAIAPLMVGIIGASFVCRPLIEKLGRLLVIIGLAVTLAGTVGCGPPSSRRDRRGRVGTRSITGRSRCRYGCLLQQHLRRRDRRGRTRGGRQRQRSAQRRSATRRSHRLSGGHHGLLLATDPPWGGARHDGQCGRGRRDRRALPRPGLAAPQEAPSRRALRRGTARDRGRLSDTS